MRFRRQNTVVTTFARNCRRKDLRTSRVRIGLMQRNDARHAAEQDHRRENHQNCDQAGSNRYVAHTAGRREAPKVAEILAKTATLSAHLRGRREAPAASPPYCPPGVNSFTIAAASTSLTAAFAVHRKNSDYDPQEI